MMRAYLIELAVMKQYFRQIAGIGFLTAVFVSVGMQTVVAAPAMFAMLYLVMSTSAVNAYDEQNAWGAFRLTMPLTRRDVVRGRYAVVGTLALFTAAIGLAASAALMAVSPMLPLPADMRAGFAATPENLSALCFALAFVIALGSLIVAVVMPVYLRFGQTKATQWLPLLSMLVTIGLAVIAGSGVSGSVGMLAEAVEGALRFMETPAGMASCIAIALVFACAVLACSSVVAERLYRHREL